MTAYTRNRLLFAILLLSTMSLQGQMVTGMSDIAIQCVGCGVDSYSLTELDYAAAQYYDARADGFLSRGGSIVNSRSAYGAPYVDFYLSTALYYNTTYQIQTNHWIKAYYLVYVTEYGDYRYEDPYGFSWLDTGNYDHSAQIEPSYTYSYVTTQDIYVGATYAGFHSPSPVISGINVLGNPTRGGSGHVEIYGSYFDGLQSVSIDGGGITTSVTYQSDTQVNISYSIASSASTGGRNLTVTTIFGPSNSKTFTVYDATPNINSISPNTWSAGGTTSFTISGTGFGSNPSVSISGAGITGYTASGNDTSISGSVTISSNAPGGSATVTVTSNGYGGSGFMPAPVGGSTNQAAAATTIAALSISMKLERLGMEISTDGRYSEDTTIRVTAVRSYTGEPITDWTGTVNIAEDGTAIYPQNGGSLPSSVNITSGGSATFVAKSLAGPKDVSTKPDAARIKTTNYPMRDGQSLQVPQWVISGARIDPHSTGQVYDWLQARTRDIFDSATGDKYTVLAAISSYSMGYLPGLLGQANWLRAAQSPIVLNPYFVSARLNSTCPARCGSACAGSLTNTLLHEARHAYVGSRAAVGGNDQDGDFLVTSIPVAPTSIFLDTTTARDVCDSTQVFSLSYHGDNVFDAPNAPDFASYAWEMDAYTFAGAHDH